MLLIWQSGLFDLYLYLLSIVIFTIKIFEPVHPFQIG